MPLFQPANLAEVILSTRVSPRTLRGQRPISREVHTNVSSDQRGQGFVVDRAAELAVYDALPERWRRLVDSLPIPQGMASIEDYRAKLGDDAAYDRVVEVFRARYPGWESPTEADQKPTPAPQSLRRRRRGEIVVPSSNEDG